VDCKRLPGLDTIGVLGEKLVIGAAVTHRQVEGSPQVASHLPELARLTAHIGNVRVRAAGTLGGNLCFADPHSDPATLLVALDARVRLESGRGGREVPCAQFATGPYETVRAPDELLIGIDIPVPQPSVIAFERISFRERPIVNVAIVRGEAGFAVAIAGGARMPRRLPEVEQRLAELDANAVPWQHRDYAACAVLAAQALDPTADLSGGREFKRQLARVVFLRAVRRAVGPLHRYARSDS
jgi:carbon-monoxide dehydrogenase medium subunit